MTRIQQLDRCDICKHQGWIKCPDGADMFCCAKEDDPWMPFTIDEDTVCPLFEEDEDKAAQIAEDKALERMAHDTGSSWDEYERTHYGGLQ